MPRDSETAKSDRELLKESAQRSRRIETKVTMIANHLGIDAGEQKPRYNAEENAVYVTSPKCSIEDLLAAIPAGRIMVAVYKGSELLLTLTPAC